MLPTSMTPSVFQVGTSAVGDPSPGKHAAILTNRPRLPRSAYPRSFSHACMYHQDTRHKVRAAVCQENLIGHGYASFMIGWHQQGISLMKH